MARGKAAVDGVTVLQIVAAVFLITLGLIGIVHYNSNLAQFGRGLNRLFGRSNDPMNLILAAIQLAAGIIVFAGVFFSVRSRLIYGATLVIVVLWVIRIVLVFFTSDLFEPDLLLWLNRLSADLIVLLTLWLINRRYA